MSAWRPGDVAMIRVGTGDWEVGLHQDDGSWACRHAANRRDWETVELIRPLVVIDPESDETADALAKALVEAMYRAGDHASAANGCHPATIKAALRSLLAPPRPDEPTGLGAVVEDQRGEWWVRDKTTTTVNHWKRARGEDGGRRYPYADIAAVRVLSEGVAE